MNTDNLRERLAEQILVVRKLLAPNSNTAAHLWLLERDVKLRAGFDELAEVRLCADAEPPQVKVLLLPAVHELGIRIEALLAHITRAWDRRCSACGDYSRDEVLVEGLCPSCRAAAEEAKRYAEGA